MRASASRVAVLALSPALASACAGGGPSTTATATEATTSMTVGSDGMSSTSAGTTTTTTTTESTATMSETTDDSTSTGCTFVCGPDVGPEQPEECDLWSQDCPEGEKCSAWASDGGGSWNATKCVPVDPNPGDVGEPCTVEGSAWSGVDSCVKGAMCFQVDPETDTGVCVPLCQGQEQHCVDDPASCCPPATICTISAQGTLIHCKPMCHPIAQDCDSKSEVCYAVDDYFQCAVDVSRRMGAAGDPCEFIPECDPGTYCGDPSTYPGCDPMAGGCCIPFCELDNPATCAPGTACEPWYEPMDAPPGYEDLGACVIPS